MSDDGSYGAFLEQANQSTSSGGGGGGASTQASKKKQFPSTRTVSANQQPPQALRDLNATYTSDSDEPFEPVALKTDGDTLDGDTLAFAAGHAETAEEIALDKFDAHGEYKQIIDAVRKHGDVKVFRMQGEGARAEYWVVALEKERIVGVRARAVES